MASVNITSVMDAVKRYSKTDAGKKRMSDAIEGLRVSGKEKTLGGSELMTLDKMHDIAKELIEDLRDYAMINEMEGKLPRSIARLFDELTFSAAYYKDRGEYQYVIDVIFDADLSRTSLFDLTQNKYTGSGVDNIINLFDKGYSAKKTVWGVWYSESRGGEGIYASSVSYRPYLGFMENAIEYFNSTKGDMYNCKAKLLWEGGD